MPGNLLEALPELEGMIALEKLSAYGNWLRRARFRVQAAMSSMPPKRLRRRRCHWSTSLSILGTAAEMPGGRALYICTARSCVFYLERTSGFTGPIRTVVGALLACTQMRSLSAAARCCRTGMRV